MANKAASSSQGSTHNHNDAIEILQAAERLMHLSTDDGNGGNRRRQQADAGAEGSGKRKGRASGSGGEGVESYAVTAAMIKMIFGNDAEKVVTVRPKREKKYRSLEELYKVTRRIDG